MKEYIIKEKSQGKYEYGYKIQKLDIKLMIDLGLMLPGKIIEEYKKTNNEYDFIYFYDYESVEFLKSQYYIRDYIEFASMNAYELNLLINNYHCRIDKLTIEMEETIKELNKRDISKTKYIKLKEKRDKLSIDIFILENDLKGIKYLKDKVLKEEEKNNRK